MCINRIYFQSIPLPAAADKVEIQCRSKTNGVSAGEEYEALCKWITSVRVRKLKWLIVSRRGINERVVVPSCRLWIHQENRPVWWTQRQKCMKMDDMAAPQKWSQRVPVATWCLAAVWVIKQFLIGWCNKNGGGTLRLTDETGHAWLSTCIGATSLSRLHPPIATEQTPHDICGTRWQLPFPGYYWLHYLDSGRRWRCVVHLLKQCMG